MVTGCGEDGPPYSPEEARALIEVPEGFRVELAAAEPDIVDPVAMTFDARGRMYVVEMRDYPLDLEPQGQVTRLEDSDGDGYFETSIVFADGLNFPNGIMRWRDGILVTAAPDIIYLEDSDGDGRADIRRVVLTGFAATNPQLRVTPALRGGQLDLCKLPAGDSGHASLWMSSVIPVRRCDFPNTPMRRQRTSCEDIRFRPDKPEIEALGNASQYGNSFDDWGNRFTVWNNDYVRYLILESRYLKRNPYLAVEKAYDSPSGLDHSAPVYPITENRCTFTIRRSVTLLPPAACRSTRAGIYPRVFRTTPSLRTGAQPGPAQHC